MVELFTVTIWGEGLEQFRLVSFDSGATHGLELTLNRLAAGQLFNQLGDHLQKEGTE